MNKKGFTLIELLAVIVIIALLGGIGIVSYNSFQIQTGERVFETYMDSMHESAIMYFLENSSERPTSSNTRKIVYLSNLKMDKFNNPFGERDYCVNDGSYVEASWQDKTSNKGMTGIKYKVCLNCNDYKKCKDYIN